MKLQWGGRIFSVLTAPLLLWILSSFLLSFLIPFFLSLSPVFLFSFCVSSSPLVISFPLPLSFAITYSYPFRFFPLQIVTSIVILLSLFRSLQHPLHLVIPCRLVSKGDVVMECLIFGWLTDWLADCAFIFWAKYKHVTQAHRTSSPSFPLPSSSALSLYIHPSSPCMVLLLFTSFLLLSLTPPPFLRSLILSSNLTFHFLLPLVFI